MSRWTKLFFLVLLCAANASPVLARQSHEYSRFPKTLQEAIVPVDATRRPAVKERKRVTRTDSKNRNRPIDSLNRESRSDVEPNAINTRRKTPAKKVSSNRFTGRYGSNSRTGNTTNFEFGTVMMFPANGTPKKPRKLSNTYKRPSKNASLPGPGIRLDSDSTASRLGAEKLLAQVAPKSELPGDTFLSTSVYGPMSLRQDSPEEFEIVIVNPTAQRATNIIVQLKTPGGITISKLDRQAWLDEVERTVSWKIDEIPSGYKTSILFNAVSGTIGNHQQRVTVGMDNVYQGETTFETRVTPPGEQEQSTINF